MKPTAGYAKPRRLATSPPTRLNLQRRPKPEPEEELEQRRNAGFWKCVVAIALVHVLVILGVSLYYLFAPAKAPEPDFITLLPRGDTVKGTPGKQEAHKLGTPATAVPSHHSSTPPPAPAHVAPPTPKPVTPPTVVKPPTPTPIIKDNTPAPAPVKPVKPVKPKPVKPKVKVDLQEVTRTDTTAETPPKPAPHPAKKPDKTPNKSNDDADITHENNGLTHQQIMDKIGDKLDPSGSQSAQKFGADGAPNGHANNFQDFYLLIRDQVRDAWTSPMTPAETKPIVSIHVERDGHISPGSVHLVRSSGDSAYDQAAIDTVKRVNQLREPLPNGCPPDITITFDPNPSQ